MRPVPVGESAVLDVVVTPEMTVRFDELGPVHPVYATYSMAKHFEEAGRKLLLRYLDPGEAGIGSSLSVEHLAPASVGNAVRVTARCVELRGNRLTCACTAVDTEGRLLGRGTTGQVVMSEAAVQARVGGRSGATAQPGHPEDVLPDAR